MKICTVKNCNAAHVAKGYCSKHYVQFKTYGKIRERTIHDPNEFIIDGDICWVVLYNNKCIEVARAKFLTIYYEQIKNSELKWHFDNGYASAIWYVDNVKYHTFLHEAIMQLSGQEVPDGKEVDHKDGNRLNCLDDNLRICTRPENQQNRSKLSNNTSGHKGVSWSKSNKKWQAQITVSGKRIHLGYFDTKEDAARAYNVAAMKYYGEFAVLNTIEGDIKNT